MAREQLVETCMRLESRRQMMEILLAELHNEKSKLQRHQTMLSERISRVEGTMGQDQSATQVASAYSAAHSAAVSRPSQVSAARSEAVASETAAAPASYVPRVAPASASYTPGTLV